MVTEPQFTEAEYGDRLSRVRALMAERGLDLCLVSTPENIFYLTGLDHWGYFAPHMLCVPADGEMVLVTRAMERVTITRQVPQVAFHGHGDEETAADVVVRVLGDRRAASARIEAAAEAVAEVIHERTERAPRIGLEKWSSGLPHGLAETLRERTPGALWVDVTGLVDGLRIVKSPAELAFIREAARISDTAMLAAIDAIRDGAREADIAAECHRAMFAAGGTYPGFGPFIRSTARLDEEHTSWTDGSCHEGDVVLLELSGCYRRYHAPLGRMIFVGEAPAGAREVAPVCRAAFEAALEALRPGALAREVYAAWQGVVDAAGLAGYRRHHCGYLIGIGFPPSWSGGNRVTGLRRDSDLVIEDGMSLHLMSWLVGTGRGDYLVSNTVLVGADGPELLTKTPMTIIER
jgi:Xaa-Pro dipeptidase